MAQKGMLLFLLIFALGVNNKADEIRIVDGRAYNIKRSTNWHGIACTVSEVHTNIVFANEYRNRRQRINTFGIPQYRYFREYTGGILMLRNKPADIGDDLEIIAMRVGSTNYNGKVWKLYDVGTKPNPTRNKRP